MAIQARHNTKIAEDCQPLTVRLAKSGLIKIRGQLWHRRRSWVAQFSVVDLHELPTAIGVRCQEQ